MRLPKRGERGFTLIELLIVVAILGVLAAVVIPNVTRFFGQGEAEARRTEFHNVSLAVASMMIDNGISSIPVPMAYDSGAKVATNQMGLVTEDSVVVDGFPDYQSSTIFPVASPGKLTDPEGYSYATTDDPGYVLFGHDIYGGDATDPNPKQTLEAPNVSYLNMQQTVYFYTCESDGTVRQWSDDVCTTEYTD